MLIIISSMFELLIYVLNWAKDWFETRHRIWKWLSSKRFGNMTVLQFLYEWFLYIHLTLHRTLMAANERNTERFRQYLTIEQIVFFPSNAETRNSLSFLNLFLIRSILYLQPLIVTNYIAKYKYRIGFFHYLNTNLKNSY